VSVVVIPVSLHPIAYIRYLTVVSISR
jgi:hypothetical protein